MNRVGGKLVPVCGCLWLAMAAASQETVNQNHPEIPGFEQRVANYIKLRKNAERGMAHLKPTDSPAAITKHEAELAARIREVRKDAGQGEIFTAAISREFRRRIAVAMQGQEAARIMASLKHAEPVSLSLQVNQAYPHSVPLQSMPPTLLLNLPVLPKELEYRIVWPDLILRDIGANLIVDFIPGAMP